MIPIQIVKRIDWYIELLKTLEKRAKCREGARTGAIIATPDTGRVISMGYNGPPPGVPHCEDVGCVSYNGHCIATIHAESNALSQLNNYGVYTNVPLAIITTYTPCLNCLKNLISFNIKWCISIDYYEDEAREVFLNWLHVNGKELIELKLLKEIQGNRTEEKKYFPLQ